MFTMKRVIWKIDDNDLGSEPIVVKSTVYEQLYIVKS